jgi:hypothetical protein
MPSPDVLPGQKSFLEEDIANPGDGSPRHKSPVGKRTRQSKRLDANGKPMHRIVLICSEIMANHIHAAIAERRSLGFIKSYGGPRIPRTGLADEIMGLSLGLICEDWLQSMEPETGVESEE